MRLFPIRVQLGIIILIFIILFWDTLTNRTYIQNKSIMKSVYDSLMKLNYSFESVENKRVIQTTIKPIGYFKDLLRNDTIYLLNRTTTPKKPVTIKPSNVSEVTKNVSKTNVTKLSLGIG